MTGATARAGGPSSVITFLFTDIEGSTRRWEADPEAMRLALTAHDEVLGDAIAENGGQQFKHTGDGVCAAFPSPRAAVEAAVAAQRSLELPVRMGIATGEAEVRDGDYFGTVLNRAARIMAAGHGGQILLDGTTAGLLSGIDLVDLGSRRLRDISTAVAIFQVRAVGLAQDFPPLNTADAGAGNLRPPATSFVGRDAELTAVTIALESHRIVTLTGVGGVGKTRLALEVAGRVANDFPDGVWVVELAPVGDPDAVPEVIAGVLGINQQPGLSLLESVAHALDGRQRLLIFDNCEHVLDAAAQAVEAICARSSSVRILATSREGLRVSDEQLWPVAPLAVAAGAIDLFVDRASAVSPDTSLAHRAVVEICERLDGIPLAIELAASRMQSMTATELRDRLDDRFRLLVGARRGLERHQTLRHAVQWSYDLLSNDEKSLLAGCSVFAGGFDLSAASCVGGIGDELATLDLLDSLVRKSLLAADRSSERTRYSMLETIRQFAEDQLVLEGAAEQARDTHADYFAGLEDAFLALWDSPRQAEAYTWLAVELANFRAAFRWTVLRGDVDRAARIAVFTNLVGFWQGLYEPSAWAEELLESAKAMDHPRLAQLYVMASQCYALGRVDDSIAYGEAARKALDSGRFDPVPFEFEACLGSAHILAGQPERWVALCRNMIDGSPGEHPYARQCLAYALFIAGSHDEAIEATSGLIEVAERTGNPATIISAYLAYGFVRRFTEPAPSSAAMRRALVIAEGSGNRFLLPSIAGTLAHLKVTEGEPLESLDLLETAIRHFYDSGNLALTATPLAILVVLLVQLEYYEAAATISPFAINPLTNNYLTGIDTAVLGLRRSLGDDAYEALSGAGRRMPPVEMVAYGLKQIERARAQLLAAD
ncbi:MAG TPA: adenylate/guanylate cyclase domain-containing protein [Mycobacterium sp.]|nr:adenylate/guanylate cyclase domain-containing protein [Mycobacterium sp.]